MAAECNVGEFAVNVPVLRWSRGSFSDVTWKEKGKAGCRASRKAGFLGKNTNPKKRKVAFRKNLNISYTFPHFCGFGSLSHVS